MFEGATSDNNRNKLNSTVFIDLKVDFSYVNWDEENIEDDIPHGLNHYT